MSNNFTKRMMIYFFGIVLSKLLQVFLLPLYTTYISPEGFGKYDFALVIVSFFASVFFLDIWDSMLLFVNKVNDTKKSTIVQFNSLIIFSVSSIIYIVIAFLVLDALAIDYVFLALSYGLVMNVQIMSSFFARSMGKSKLLVVSGIINTIVQIVLNIVLLMVFRFDYSSLFYSSIAGHIVQSLIIVFVVFVVNKSPFVAVVDIQLIRSVLKHSYPLVLNSILYWLLSAANRVLLTNQASSFENGIYATALKFNVAVSLVFSSINMSWQESAFQIELERPEANVIISKSLANVFLFSVFLYIGLLFTVGVSFNWLIAAAYGQSYDLVPFTILSAVFGSLSLFTGYVITKYMRTKVIALTSLLGVISNFLFIYFTMSSLGVMSVAIASALGYIVVFFSRLLYIQILTKGKIRIHPSLVIVISVIVSVAIILFYFDLKVLFLYVLIATAVLAFYTKDEISKVIRPLVGFIKGSKYE